MTSFNSFLPLNVDLFQILVHVAKHSDDETKFLVAMLMTLIPYHQTAAFIHPTKAALDFPTVTLDCSGYSQKNTIQLPVKIAAIASAAHSDEQLNEGKALSDREEAVLQALELLTRNADEVVRVKGMGLREKIRSVLGQSTDDTGNAKRASS